MDLVSSVVLEDERFCVPETGGGDTGTAWLRSHVARFSEGESHARQRVLIDDVLAELTVWPTAGCDPTAVLLEAMGLPARCATDVAAVASSYQPHLPQSDEADAAVERLVSACGERDEQTAARICCLVQAHSATRAMVEMLRAGRQGPPVPTTRRVGPDGAVVEVDLSDAHFGRGHHACPGREIALRLAEAAAR